jgi:hypothetical protein
MRRHYGLLYPLLLIAAISIVIFSAWSMVALFGLFSSAHASGERPTIALATARH